MSTFLASVNNIPANTMQSNIVQVSDDDGGTILIQGNGGDNISNIQVKIYDQNNLLIETLIFGTNEVGEISTGWRVEYIGNSGAGNSCTNGGKDWIKFEDGNGNITYDIPEQCIQLASTMPITYAKPLEATQKQNSTILTWSVVTQINNDKYIIEHRRDGRDFLSIGEIEGDGTNNAERHYTYTHKTPSIGVNYYRIKQIDYDGQYSYSNIASVVYEGNYSEIAIYPNPATDEVKIYIPNNTNLTITDIYGRTAKTLSIIEGENSIDIKELPSGFYIFALGDRKYRVLKE